MLKRALRFFNEKFMFPRRYAFLTEALRPFLAEAQSVLDVGSSNGRLIQKIVGGMDGIRVEGVDILVQPNAVIPIQAYDGKRIPHGDGSFDTVILIDVLHHADDPVALLREAARVARVGVVVKDHYWKTKLDWTILKWADYGGNDPMGIVLPYHYFTVLQWHAAIEATGLSIASERAFTRYSYDPCKHIIYDLRKQQTAA